MEDAQGRFNLRNLVDNGQVIERELDALRRLVSLLQLPEQTADLIALRMAQALPAPTGTDSANPTDALIARARQTSSAAADVAAGHRRHFRN